MVELKKCKKCGELRDLTDFYPGRLSCKQCKKEADATYRKRHAGAIELRLVAWAEDNKERAKEIKDNWRRNNPAKVRNSQRTHYKAHPEKAAQTWRNGRARRAGIPGRHTSHDIAALMHAQQGKCVYCSCDITGYYEVDHKIPVVKEGSSNWPENLQLLCKWCNRSKGAKSHEEFVTYLKALRPSVYTEAA